MTCRTVPAALALLAGAAAPALGQFTILDDYRDVYGEVTLFMPGPDVGDAFYITASDPLFSHDETLTINHANGWLDGRVIHTSNVTPTVMTFETDLSLEALAQDVPDVRMIGVIGSAAGVRFTVDEPTTVRAQGSTGDSYITLYDYTNELEVFVYFFDIFDDTYELEPGIEYEIGFGLTVGVDTPGTGDLHQENNSASLVFSIEGAAPCPADLAAPFGTLNFFDVTAFLNAFNNQLPAADFAPPSGSYNFFDVSAFLAAYNAGCP